MVGEPDTDRPSQCEPCERLACPFETALDRLKEADARRIRSEQSIVENLDRLADSFFRLQREAQDRARDVIEARRAVDSNAVDVLNLRNELRELHKVQLHTARKVGSIKYWLAAIVGAVAFATQFVEPLLRILVHR